MNKQHWVGAIWLLAHLGEHGLCRVAGGVPAARVVVGPKRRRGRLRKRGGLVQGQHRRPVGVAFRAVEGHHLRLEGEVALASLGVVEDAPRRQAPHEGALRQRRWRRRSTLNA